MRSLKFILCASLSLAFGIAAQAASNPNHHLVMLTRAGPNFANVKNHMDDARAHQAIYVQLVKDGYTIGGGAFLGEPVLGMTIWCPGIDEAKARQLIANDKLPGLGIVTYEFRTLEVRTGAFVNQCQAAG